MYYADGPLNADICKNNPQLTEERIKLVRTVDAAVYITQMPVFYGLPHTLGLLQVKLMIQSRVKFTEGQLKCLKQLYIKVVKKTKLKSPFTRPHAVSEAA